MSVDHVMLASDDSKVFAKASDGDKAKVFAFDLVGEMAKSAFFVTEQKAA